MENLTQPTRTKEFLDAAGKLLPILKTIPKDVIKRHNLSFEKIIEETIKTKKEWRIENQTLEEILNGELSYYIKYGVNAFTKGYNFKETK